MAFLDNHFLLNNKTAHQLYHEVAAPLPIYDYHCHLDPADIAGNRVYDNLTEIWLEGDHYKWRAMRANGIDEAYITGSADPYDKFLAWARTVPFTLRNPLYHWTHLELQRYFGIDSLLNEDTAPEIWTETQRQLTELSTHAIFDKFKVAVTCTTDDPADSLQHHETIAQLGLETKVYPTFRPDKAFNLCHPVAWNAYLDRLGAAAGLSIDSWAALQEALDRRHEDFYRVGGRLSDHGLTAMPSHGCTDEVASKAFAQARAGEALSMPLYTGVTARLLAITARLDAKRGFTKQLHLGAMRDTNSRLHETLGPDIGGDSIGDFRQGPGLQHFLDSLDRKGQLPKTILYNVNPKDNYLFAAMAGNFQQGPTPGKIQYGAGWWYLDQKEGITWQLNALSNVGLLARFVGMLTDSRSMMSYPRHEYFRRILCNLIGADAERGELPDDFEMLSKLVADICFNNARDYFGLKLDPKYARGNPAKKQSQTTRP